MNSVKGTVMGGQMAGVNQDDKIAVTDALGEVLESILDGVEDATTGVTTINVDSTLKKECPDVHAAAVKACGGQRPEHPARLIGLLPPPSSRLGNPVSVRPGGGHCAQEDGPAASTSAAGSGRREHSSRRRSPGEVRLIPVQSSY
ncbi:hypothetical protein Kisp02_40930 [Kineosporia sp. NBRC 101731]|nr:hypothetical protein Kisp02_40930 [Kineosporia sp. NBRC 101731]